MTPFRPTLIALLVIAAAGASTGSSGTDLQARRTRTMAPETLDAEPPPQLLAAAGKQQAAAVVATPLQKVEVGFTAKVRRGAAWLGSFRMVHHLRDSVALAIQRGRSMVGAKAPAESDESTDMVLVISTLVSFSLGMLIIGGVAFLYKQQYISPPVDLEKATESFKDQGFAHGPFDCHEDMEILAWSCCCGGIRWADTMQSIGMLTFWVALGLFMFAVLLDGFTGGIVMWIVVALIFTYYRQELRKKFSMKNEGEDQIKDFGMWCCCSCCAIAQEARHIKAAPKLKQEEAATFQA